MLSLSDILDSQRRYGVMTDAGNADRVSYSVYLGRCRRHLSDKTPRNFYDWDKERQASFTKDLIFNFVSENKKDVEGFIGDDGELFVDKLLERLVSDISDYGILGDALKDESIQEIQINDHRTIWVVRGGKAQLYTDAQGKPLQFENDEELKSTIDRMIFNPNGNSPRMTIAEPLMNTRTTAKGYRLSSVDSTAITRDLKEGYDFPCTSVTIRKYSQSRLTFENFVETDTMTAKMAAFLRLCGKANIRLACVGETSSGKTTLLNAIVWEIPRDQRLILVQNPTEIMVYERSDADNGTNLRNVLHWEASEVSSDLKDSPLTPTMSNFIAHTLRNTPDVIIPGEVRTPEEFFQMLRALKTGHRVLTTFHAKNAAEAVERMANELAQLSGNVTDYLSTITRSLDIIVSQQKLEDGRRRVVGIEELLGGLTPDGVAKTNVLFTFEMTGEMKRDPDTGELIEIVGNFKQKNPISDKLVQAFYAAGISKDELAPFTSVSDDSDFTLDGKSAYTGEPIDASDLNIQRSLDGSDDYTEHGVTQTVEPEYDDYPTSDDSFGGSFDDTAVDADGDLFSGETFGGDSTFGTADDTDGIDLFGEADGAESTFGDTSDAADNDTLGLGLGDLQQFKPPGEGE